MSIIIEKVTNSSMLKKFVQFNIDLYEGNPNHVPALIFDEIATLNPTKNPAFDFCEAACFLAYNNDEIVGRIAVIINHKSNEIWNQNRARFGFVDFIDDERVVKALFSAAEEWARLRRVTQIHGPLGFTDLDHEGLLIEGYDCLGTMGTTYCFPYYKDHIEKYGFVKDQDWTEFLIPIPKEIPERHKRVAEVVLKRFGLIARTFENKKEVLPYAREIFLLLNRSYSNLYGYVPLTDKQIDYYVKMYIPMLRLDFLSVILRQEDNKMVGFGLAMPSMSHALQKARGKFLPTGWFHLLKAIKGKNNKILDLCLVAVDPEYQGKGLNAILFNQFIPAANKQGFEVAESNPELELNSKVQSMWNGFDVVHHKTRRAYIKDI